MNERIIELAEQAGLELGTVLKDYVTPVKSITIEQRKFAELIVAECLDNCMAANDRDRIREHFGVEE